MRIITRLLLGAVLLLVVFLALDTYRRPDDRRGPDAGRVALSLDADEVGYIRIQRAEGPAITCVRTADGWRMQEPVTAPAGKNAILHALHGLEVLKAESVVTPAERRRSGVSLADYGLDPPVLTLSIGADAPRRRILFGRSSLLDDRVFMCEYGPDPVVVTVDASFLERLPADPNHYRDHRLIAGRHSQFSRIGIRRRNMYLDLVYDNRGGRWQLRQPCAAPADDDVVRELVQGLNSLEVREFVADGAVNPADYGLEQPPLQAILWPDGEQNPRTLLISRPSAAGAGLCFAMWQQEESVFTLPDLIHDLLGMELARLRAPRLLTMSEGDIRRIEIGREERSLVLGRTNDQWRILSPRNLPADDKRVERLMAAWTGCEVQGMHYGAADSRTHFLEDQDVLRLTFASGDSPDDGSITVAVDGQPRADGMLVVAVMGEDPVYWVNRNILQPVSLDPLFYRAREVLELDADNIRRISLTVNGSSWAVSRDAAGQDFRCDNDGAADTRQVKQVLRTVERLSATGFEGEFGQDMRRFGLDEPRIYMEFGLSGESGIGKRLMIGGSSSAGEAYARIRGRDIVFRLSAETVAQLTAPLCRPAADHADGEEGSPANAAQ